MTYLSMTKMLPSYDAPASTRKQRPLEEKRKQRMSAAAQTALEDLEPAWMLPLRTQHDAACARLRKEEGSAEGGRVLTSDGFGYRLTLSCA